MLKTKPGKLFELKRKNFIEKGTEHFKFLCDEFGYTGPEHTFFQQENGSITCDELIYSNAQIDRQITFYNAYHPNDYGFELRFYRPSLSTHRSESIMAYYVLKENQDVEQTYLMDVVKVLKENFYDVLSGEEWINIE